MLSSRTGTRRSKAFLGLLILAVAGPMCGGGGAAAPPPPIFQVLNNYPLQGATAVARTAKLYVQVNGTPTAATLNNTNITLTGISNIPIGLLFDPVNGMIEITPSVPTPQNFMMTLKLFSGLTSTLGASLVPKTITFTTANVTDTVLPTFGGLTSATVVDKNSIALAWSTPGSDDITLPGGLFYDVYVSTTSGFFNYGPGPLISTPSPGATGITITSLSSNTTYFFVVRCRDAAGNQDTNVYQQSAKTLVSFNGNLYTPIINNICVQCHAPTPAIASFMDLTGGSSLARSKWVNIPTDTGTGGLQACQAEVLKRVLPVDPLNSVVYRKVAPDDAGHPRCGVRMPEGGPYLSTAEIQLFFDWISQGALDN
jgi:hypothetical protein